jgi:hypothetical protein
MNRRVLVVLVLLVAACAGYLGFTATDSVTAPAAVAAAKTYSATVYVAGMGGHFAQADVIIDPSNAKEPVKVAKLDRVAIGDKTTHPTHDARIDASDPNVMFWSTYVRDPQGKMHVGKSDLKTGKVIMDVAMDPDPKAPGTKGPLYCASGQSKNFYMPVFMGTEGYVDVLDKKDLSLKHRVFVSDPALGYATGSYKFVHGINSPDMKMFLLVLNQAKEGKGTGDVDFVLLDMASLEQGKAKVVKKNTLKGEPDKTLTFRQYFSTDGKLIFQSAADRMWVVDAKTLKLVDEKMAPEGSQIHDAMPTPDSKFALVSVRSLTQGCDAGGEPLPGKEITDGVLFLYDAGAKKLNTNASSVCFGCHKGMGLGDKNAVLCGIDAAYNK